MLCFRIFFCFLLFAFCNENIARETKWFPYWFVCLFVFVIGLFVSLCSVLMLSLASMASLCCQGCLSLLSRMPSQWSCPHWCSYSSFCLCCHCCQLSHPCAAFCSSRSLLKVYHIRSIPKWGRGWEVPLFVVKDGKPMIFWMRVMWLLSLLQGWQANDRRWSILKLNWLIDWSPISYPAPLFPPLYLCSKSTICGWDCQKRKGQEHFFHRSSFIGSSSLYLAHRWHVYCLFIGPCARRLDWRKKREYYGVSQSVMNLIFVSTTPWHLVTLWQRIL